MEPVKIICNVGVGGIKQFAVGGGGGTMWLLECDIEFKMCHWGGVHPQKVRSPPTPIQTTPTPPNLVLF